MKNEASSEERNSHFMLVMALRAAGDTEADNEMRE